MLRCLNIGIRYDPIEQTGVVRADWAEGRGEFFELTAVHEPYNKNIVGEIGVGLYC